MSFYDNMIDDGYSDAMDYMDHLMAKANDMDYYSSRDDNNDDEEEYDDNDDDFDIEEIE